MIQEIKGGVCAVDGVKAFGVKESKYGLAVIVAKGNAAGVYTKNKVVAAPVIVTKEKLETNGGYLEAVIANSGNANAFTGDDGLKDANDMANTLAECLDVDPKYIAVASTGVIGRKLHIDKIKDQIGTVFPNLDSSEKANAEAMKAIMTTDLVPKGFAVEAQTAKGNFRVGGIAKGSGMIEPNMGTMLSFVYTDAEISASLLQSVLAEVTDRTFNRIVVDGDTSTNDMCLVTATGKSGVNVNLNDEAVYSEFLNAFETVMKELAKMIAKDGEGATKLIECTVTGAYSEDDAVSAAKSIVRSPLVKTAIFGNDPNWGRIVAAAGYSGADFDQSAISLDISDGSNQVFLVKAGKITENDSGTLEKLKAIMSAETIFISMDLGTGYSETATAWGCDLTYDYVKINADYTT
ncbi:Arginine biosynthesis bifunctional protein ArgJ [Methanimicrococcus stummii]|uniref:Glutamate N-acetyltransferase n=1 Tax=Methanimicrococcus stummii TaxID=3028294 RepID=A0AA96V9L0_9EURY|nr:bifunctional ornithine acetyltransferase/N-acetylglutamate synthase [Methanimicrococcus sp. Es2]WNY28255.1 Arginine biosynthesis bifunctional protein ArgJ [Methanimicrococcus sp. Es2]